MFFSATFRYDHLGIGVLEESIVASRRCMPTCCAKKNLFQIEICKINQQNKTIKKKAN